MTTTRDQLILALSIAIAMCSVVVTQANQLEPQKAKSTGIPVVDSKTKTPVVAMWRGPHLSPFIVDKKRLEFAIWEGGLMVYSEVAKGRVTIKSVRIPKEHVAALVKVIASTQNNLKRIERFSVFVDGPCYGMLLNNGKSQKSFLSSYEATDEDPSKFELTPEIKALLKNWQHVRTSVAKVIKANEKLAKPTAGRFLRPADSWVRE